MGVPLVDLGWQHDQISNDVETGLKEVYAATSFIQGPQVGLFEEEFAAFSAHGICQLDLFVGKEWGGNARLTGDHLQRIDDHILHDQLIDWSAIIDDLELHLNRCAR